MTYKGFKTIDYCKLKERDYKVTKSITGGYLKRRVWETKPLLCRVDIPGCR